MREILYRSLYRGELVWNKTRKRNRWGVKQPHDRPVADWIRLDCPALCIVTDEIWHTAHLAIAAHRAQYARAVAGRPFGTGAKYLLTGLLQCGLCGGGMEARSRAHGSRGRRQAERVVFYGCAGYHRRGSVVCANRHTVPMRAANEAILSAIEAQMLNPAVLKTAVERLAEELSGGQPVLSNAIERELAEIETELDRLTRTLIREGESRTIFRAIREREDRQSALEADLAALAKAKQWKADRAEIIQELTARLANWRARLAEQSGPANRLLRQMISGKLMMSPSKKGYRSLGSARCSQSSLDSYDIIWRPQRGEYRSGHAKPLVKC